MDGIDVLADFIESPRRAAEAARRDPPYGLALAAFALAGLSVFLAQALAGRFQLLGVTWASLLSLCLWRVLWGLLCAAVFHLTAEALGGRGRVLPLFTLFGLSDLAWTLLLPGTLLCLAFLPSPRWGVFAFSLAVGFVSFSLKARSLSHNYDISLRRAFVVLSVPVGVVMAALFAMFSLAVWSAVARLVKLAA